MGNENDDIKVIDKRFSANSTETPEKEKGKEEAKEEAKGEGFTMRNGEKEQSPPDQIDFSTFVFSLATGALINLGLAPDPVTQKTEKNIPLAKQNIDILGILEAKTKGNLTADEMRLFENLLAEVRLRYVEATK